MWCYYCRCVGKLVTIKAQQKIRELSWAEHKAAVFIVLTDV